MLEYYNIILRVFNESETLTLHFRDSSPNMTYEYNWSTPPIEFPHIERRIASSTLDTPVAWPSKLGSCPGDGQLARGSRTRDSRCAGPPRDNWRESFRVHATLARSRPRVRCCRAICFAFSLRHNYSVDRTFQFLLFSLFSFLTRNSIVRKILTAIKSQR